MNRLNFIRFKQDTLRADQYKGLVDLTDKNGDLSDLGRRFILPSSFIGGPRHMTQLYQDAMSVVRSLGKDILLSIKLILQFSN